MWYSSVQRDLYQLLRQTLTYLLQQTPAAYVQNYIALMLEASFVIKPSVITLHHIFLRIIAIKPLPK